MRFRAGMALYALVFLLGVVSVQQLSVLPTLNQLLLLFSSLVAGVSLFWLLSRVPGAQSSCSYIIYVTLIVLPILLYIIGIIVVSLYAGQQLSHRLDDDLIGKNLLIKGYVSNVPTVDGQVQRFEFRIESFRIPGQGDKAKQSAEALNKFPQKIRLSWYYARPVTANDRWQLEVRLKPPHGFSNPGGFDYEAWLFQHGLNATGYVRKSALNQKKSESADRALNGSINRFREELGDKIDTIASHTQEAGSSALIKALAIGDKSSISKQQWKVLAATGTSHLMAISGLHIGLAALFAYILIRRSLPGAVIKWVPAQHIALTAGLIVALLYALVAGLSVPTQRAFIMLLTLSAMMLIRRNHRPVDALGAALFIVLIIDPLAILSAGFWFSFSAVAVIFISIGSSETASSIKQTTTRQIIWHKVITVLKRWIRLQLLISVFLLPLSLFMFQQASLISPLANLLLIPYVSFLVVPLVLLAITFSTLLPDFADVLFYISAFLLDLVWPILVYLSSLPHALWVQGDVSAVKVLMTTAALCLLYFSRPLAGMISCKLFNQQHYKKTCGLLLMISVIMGLPIFFSNHSVLGAGEFKLTVLDVGQGSAAVLQTQHHVLVFDSGARFSGKLDAGSNVVVPYLRSQGVRSIDVLIISHGDADHIGGAQAILDVYPQASVIGSELDELHADNKQVCSEGLAWRWDGVDFEFLSPAMGELEQLPAIKRNNRSCVLHVRSKSGSVLFTGDIEDEIEQKLLSRYGGDLRSDILIVPHHGSKTSSRQEFIDSVNAKVAILSVGYKNRYKLPNKRVMSRYLSANSTVLRTDESGAISVQVSQGGKLQVEKNREKNKRYWHHQIR